MFVMSLALPAGSAAAAANAHSPIIDPGTLRTANLTADFGPRAVVVRKHYAEYAALARAGRLAAAVPVTVLTVEKKPIDVLAAFTFANQLNIALLLEHKKPLSALGPDDSIPAVSNASLERALALLMPARVRHNAVRALLAAPSPPVASMFAPVPADAHPCPAASASPAPFDPATAWAELKALAANRTPAGTPVERCSLSFVHALEGAENVAAALPAPAPVPIPLPTMFAYGGRTLGAEMVPAYRYTYAADGLTLHAEASIDAHAPGFDRLPIFLVTTDLTSPAAGKPTVSVAIAAAQSPVFAATFPAADSGPFQLNAIGPTHDVTLFDPVRLHVNDLIPVPLGIGLDAELDSIGSIGFNGEVQTAPFGAFVQAKPLVRLGIRGDLVARELFASVRVDGTFYLVNVQGNFGFIVALVPDPTAAAYLPATLAGTTPVIAMYRPWSNVTYGAVTGNLTITARLAGLPWPWTHEIPLKIPGPTLGGGYSDTGTWRAVYVTNAATPAPPPAATASAAPAATASAAPALPAPVPAATSGT
jgi:hypothetical protein